MAASPLFSSTDLKNLAGYDVDSSRATMVERVTWGIIKPVLRPVLAPQGGPFERPSSDDLDETVFSVAVQIGLELYENPAALSASSAAGDSTTFASGRVADLLEQLRSWVADETSGAGGGTSGPVGSFPPAQPWPDPAWSSWATPGNRW